MARDIGMAPDAKVYRAVIIKSYADGSVFTAYEGPYDKIGSARARVTFWENHFAKRDNGDKATGHVEQCQPAWEKAPARARRRTARTSAASGDEAPKDPVALIRAAMAQRRGMHGSHAADLLAEHGFTEEADRIRAEVCAQMGHLSAKQALQLLTAAPADGTDR
ncbi:hypothetical protein HUT19_42175 (plasmid) [Streptomyces sp. NA02950]|uniref:hypothetical protein n=1 Tax=Streptomyces sp. NA02950 TaxID=2742137 RepID=UPI001591AF28|nr:hypothetical protein [Streptomyces sp. NA02950]QKV98326.1 hypothetical protein HUT19_42175 [Streptomyces sp. NA02950]